MYDLGNSSWIISDIKSLMGEINIWSKINMCYLSVLFSSLLSPRQIHQALVIYLVAMVTVLALVTRLATRLSARYSLPS